MYTPGSIRLREHNRCMMEYTLANSRYVFLLKYEETNAHRHSCGENQPTMQVAQHGVCMQLEPTCGGALFESAHPIVLAASGVVSAAICIGGATEMRACFFYTFC